MKFILLILALASVPGRAAGPVKTPHVNVELVSEVETISPGKDFWVGVHFELEKNWHIYWRNPGDSGKAPEFTWQLPDGFTAGPVVWPIPQKFLVGPLVNFGYSQSVLLMTRVSAPAGLEGGSIVSLDVQAQWLVCESACVPGKVKLDLKLPVAKDSGQQKFKSIDAALFEKTRLNLPRSLPAQYAPDLKLAGDHLELKIRNLRISDSDAPEFFPAIAQQIDLSKPAQFESASEGVVLRLPLAEPATMNSVPEISGLLKWGSDQNAWIQVGGTTQSAPEVWIGEAILLAFLGGILLNLMPCVFPVLFIKALSLVKQAHGTRREAKIRAVVYTLGVLVSFWILAGSLIALRSGGEALGWGFQLQSPGFVGGLSVLFLLLALNLLGVFEWDGAFTGAGSRLASQSGRMGAFFSGVLATLVATPCTAPFMGAALGYAISQPVVIALCVFSALGLGMALPYVLVAVVPGFARLLPKPGRWMESLKQLMAFPILATVIWMVWVLGRIAGPDAALAAWVSLLLVGMSAWIFGRWNGLLARVICILVFGAGVFVLYKAPVSVASSQATLQYGWEPYSKAKLMEYLDLGQPVFVDFTADWCVTCKVNERVALKSTQVLQSFRDHGVHVLVADWTHSDPEITQALMNFGRNGVPLYLLYSGVRGDEPKILPQILTPALMLRELERLR